VRSIREAFAPRGADPARAAAVERACEGFAAQAAAARAALAGEPALAEAVEAMARAAHVRAVVG